MLSLSLRHNVVIDSKNFPDDVEGMSVVRPCCTAAANHFPPIVCELLSLIVSLELNIADGLVMGFPFQPEQKCRRVVTLRGRR